MILGFVRKFTLNYSTIEPGDYARITTNPCYNLKKVKDKKIRKIMSLSEKKNNDYSKQYVSWLSDNNVYVSSKSTWGRPPHPCLISDQTIDEGESSGRGLIAFKNIQQNEKIIEIPESIIITDETDFNYGENRSLMNEYDRIAIFLIRERSKGNKSFWKPYLDTLPKENDLKLVFRWRLSDMIFLKGSKIPLATKYLKKKLDFQFYNLQDKIFLRDSLVFPEEIFNLQSWEWAMTILFSRAIYLQNFKKIAIVPYGDLLNHNPFSTSYIDSKSIPFSNNIEIAMYSDRSYNKFDQIFTTYGPKTNLELLILYGFSSERNPFEAYEIRVALSKNDPKFNQKLLYIKECGKTLEVTFPIFFYQYPKELYEFMTFCLFSGAELSDYDDYFSETGELTSSNTIKSVKKVLSYICKKNLMKYPMIRNENEIINLSLENNYVSKNQKVSLRQRKIEKKILARLIDI